ncbi:MAG: 2-C-methyl-D-erythritol 4-phosphate cytidylyltransferase [Acidobacteriota bacterium]|nr:2-C-methyl-D-erythritol 4-phosphate cytidylyltransferase [Acidobacteriota bacterium]
MAVALIVAAGRGERLGSGGPKALVSVAGRPMLEWSVAALRAVSAVETIVVALPGDRLDAAPAGVLAVAGGQTRSESVRAALAAAPAGAAAEAQVVVVHDAARALATPDLFAQAVAELERLGADAVVAAAPVTDTIKQVGAEGRAVELTFDRSRLWAVQTPQVFRRAALELALSAAPELISAATDDAWLVERQGGTVAVLPAPAENFKITTPLDLRVAEMLLRERGEPPGAGGGGAR